MDRWCIQLDKETGKDYPALSLHIKTLKITRLYEDESGGIKTKTYNGLDLFEKDETQDSGYRVDFINKKNDGNDFGSIQVNNDSIECTFEMESDKPLTNAIIYVEKISMFKTNVISTDFEISPKVGYDLSQEDPKIPALFPYYSLKDELSSYVIKDCVPLWKNDKTNFVNSKANTGTYLSKIDGYQLPTYDDQHEFDSWTNKGTKIDKPDEYQIPNEDIILRANYKNVTPPTDFFVVTLYADDGYFSDMGTNMISFFVKKGEKLKNIKGYITPVKDGGKQFKCWRNGETEIDPETYGITEDVILKATYKDTPTSNDDAHLVILASIGGNFDVNNTYKEYVKIPDGYYVEKKVGDQKITKCLISPDSIKHAHPKEEQTKYAPLSIRINYDEYFASTDESEHYFLPNIDISDEFAFPCHVTAVDVVNFTEMEEDVVFRGIHNEWSKVSYDPDEEQSPTMNFVRAKELRTDEGNRILRTPQYKTFPCGEEVATWVRMKDLQYSSQELEN